MTYAQKTLDYIAEHGSITSREAFIEHGNMRLADTIFKLKKAGHNIVTKMIPVLTRDGEKTMVACYTLDR